MSKVDGKRESKIKKSALKKVILSVICFILIISTCLGIVFIDKYNKMGEKVDEVPKETVASDKIYENNINITEEPDNIEIDIGSSDFKEAIKIWATTDNDKKMSDKNIINVLLVGFDSRAGTYTGNTDVMMVASLNKTTKKIKLISFLRDTYCYIESEKGSFYGKLNAAYSFGEVGS